MDLVHFTVTELPASLSISDEVNGLGDAAVQVRTSLKHVDESPFAEQLSKNRVLFVMPEGESPCG